MEEEQKHLKTIIGVKEKNISMKKIAYLLGIDKTKLVRLANK